MSETMQAQIDAAVRDFILKIQRIGMTHAAIMLGDLTVSMHDVASESGDFAPAPPPPAPAAGKKYVVRVVHDDTRKPGAKRPPSVLRGLTDALAVTIANNPGERIEPLAKIMGLASSTPLQLPIAKLLRAHRIRKQGTRRATRYWALTAGGAPTKAEVKAAKAAARKRGR